VARYGAGIRYPGQADVGRVGEHGGGHHATVVRRQAGAQVGEGRAEARPAIHLGKQTGDADAW
jgi:hypothetical protein